MEKQFKNFDEFMEFLNGGQKIIHSNGMEFMEKYQKKLGSIINTEYAKVNPFVRIYYTSLASMMDIYKNPSVQNIEGNYALLKETFKEAVNFKSETLEEIAEKVINYSNKYNSEALKIKDEFFHPPYTEITHSFGIKENEILNKASYFALFYEIDRVFNIGTFGCALADALSHEYRTYEFKKEHVAEEISRLSGSIKTMNNTLNNR